MINCNRRDGSARAVNEVAEILASRGHDVHLYARTVEDLDLGAIRWHRVPGPGWPEVADFASYHIAVNRMLAGHDYDIVHSIGCNTLRANVVTIQNIQPVKMRVLESTSAGERVSLPRRITRRLYLAVTCRAEKNLYPWREGKKPPVFLPVSHGVEKELRETYRIGPAKVRIVPNGADATVFRPISGQERRAWREANGFGPEDHLAIFSGGEWSRKGLEPAIRAVAMLPEAKLFIAGDDPDRARFQELARSCGAGGRIRFGGFRKDIPTALAASDVFLFPSHYEAFSLATIEAAACGLPIIATKINGTEDFISPGETGFFVSHEPRDIAAQLAALLADREARLRMGANARALVGKKYTWDRIASLTEEAYKLAL
ncbi:MAG: glycosyltransferase family 4 protein [Terrimicrobiaceae bacterium]